MAGWIESSSIECCAIYSGKVGSLVSSEMGGLKEIPYKLAELKFIDGEIWARLALDRDGTKAVEETNSVRGPHEAAHPQTMG